MPIRTLISNRPFAGAVFALALISCSDHGRTGPAAPQASNQLLIVSGDQQTAYMHGRVPVKVRVLDSSARPVRNAVISWTVFSGNGSVRAVDAATDESGQARANWRLGPDIGDQTLIASYESTSVVFSAQAKFEDPTSVVSVTVTPEDAALATPGAQTSLQANANGPHGNRVPQATILWSSLDSTIASVDDDGVLTGHHNGSTLIVAMAICCDHADTVNVLIGAQPAAPQLAAIVVSPKTFGLQAGASSSLLAKTLDASGRVIESVAVTWTSSDGQVALVTQSVVTGVAPGTAVISASAGGFTDSAVVTVTSGATAPVLTSVTLTPSNPTLSAGGTLQFTATARDQNGNAMTGQAFTWSSSNAAIASVSTSGLASAIADGTAVITATTGGKSASATLTVAPSAPLVGLAFADDFDTGSHAPGQNGYQWKTNSPNVTVTSDIAHSGSYSLEFRYNAKRICEHATAQQNFVLGQNLTAVFVEFWVYYPTGAEGFANRYYHRIPTKMNPDGSCSTTPSLGTNNKFFHLWDTDYAANDVGAILETKAGTALLTPVQPGDSYIDPFWETDWTAPAARHCAKWEPAITDNTPGTVQRGKWTQVRMAAAVASDRYTPDGYIKLWVNGSLVAECYAPIAASPGMHNFWKNGYLMGWANSGFDQETKIFVDDFKIYDRNPGW